MCIGFLISPSISPVWKNSSGGNNANSCASDIGGAVLSCSVFLLTSPAAVYSTSTIHMYNVSKENSLNSFDKKQNNKQQKVHLKFNSRV